MYCSFKKQRTSAFTCVLNMVALLINSLSISIKQQKFKVNSSDLILEVLLIEPDTKYI